MKQKKQQRFRQIAMIIFLVLIVLGFTITGFLNPPDSVVQIAEPRLCHTDVDCYLFCDETPKEVLCSQNLCQQNSCEEASYYAFKETPLQFSLMVELENETLSLQNRSSSQNLFVTFNDPTVSLKVTKRFWELLLFCNESVSFSNSTIKENCNGVSLNA